jgi:hypothetical protein
MTIVVVVADGGTYTVIGFNAAEGVLFEREITFAIVDVQPVAERLLVVLLTDAERFWLRKIDVKESVPICVE